MILTKKWVYLAITFPILWLVISILILIWTDTYSILHPENKNFLSEPNRNFLKVEHVLSHPKAYDGFIFGSSRVGAILPSHAQGANFYNMTYSEGIPHEHLLNLRLFLNHGVNIKKVFLGLDDFSYQVSFAKHQQQWITKSHPLATKTSWLSFYRFYFFRFLIQHDKRQFIKKLTAPKQTMHMDIDNQDSYYQAILSNRSSFQNNDPRYFNTIHYQGNTLPETLQDIQDIVTLCKKYNIALTVFINPIHHATYQDTNKQLLKKFKISLAKITPYYDFSGPNTITQNNYNFVDTSHYTVIIGDQILKKMDEFENKNENSNNLTDNNTYQSDKASSLNVKSLSRDIKKI